MGFYNENAYLEHQLYRERVESTRQVCRIQFGIQIIFSAAWFLLSIYVTLPPFHCLISSIFLLIQGVTGLLAGIHWVAHPLQILRHQRLFSFQVAIMVLIVVLEASHFVRAILKIPLYGGVELFFGYVSLSIKHSKLQVAFTYVMACLAIIQSALFCCLLWRLISVSKQLKSYEMILWEY
mmetsp:Transcript_14469/g.24706  ORF Transcript_14469/g.24706 Transcript_14469/m.24706 type:complete len:180 (+) Transcript_14469:328-867(+)